MDQNWQSRLYAKGLHVRALGQKPPGSVRAGSWGISDVTRKLALGFIRSAGNALMWFGLGMIIGAGFVFYLVLARVR